VPFAVHFVLIFSLIRIPAKQSSSKLLSQTWHKPTGKRYTRGISGGCVKSEGKSSIRKLFSQPPQARDATEARYAPEARYAQLRIQTLGRSLGWHKPSQRRLQHLLPLLLALRAKVHFVLICSLTFCGWHKPSLVRNPCFLRCHLLPLLLRCHLLFISQMQKGQQFISFLFVL
jgi:hypothetical protein